MHLRFGLQLQQIATAEDPNTVMLAARFTAERDGRTIPLGGKVASVERAPVEPPERKQAPRKKRKA